MVFYKEIVMRTNSDRGRVSQHTQRAGATHSDQGDSPAHTSGTVSYTHLDVYKRQVEKCETLKFFLQLRTIRIW